MVAVRKESSQTPQEAAVIQPGQKAINCEATSVKAAGSASADSTKIRIAEIQKTDSTAMPLPATHVGNEHLKTYSPSGDITETSLAVKLERLANVGCKALTATEPLIPYHQIKHRLRDYFRNAKEGAKFAYHENSKEAPNPGLHLWGHGMVGFPLPEGDIERVKAASASMMVAAIDAEDIDMETMNSWQIPQGLWETRNPYWEVFLKSMLEKINCALEIKEFKRGIRHIKSSLILYEPGSIVETNDTPTLSPSAFGIFEAALPDRKSVV